MNGRRRRRVTTSSATLPARPKPAHAFYTPYVLLACPEKPNGYDRRTKGQRHQGAFVPRRRMDIQTVVVGSGPVSSLVVLRPHELGEGEHPTRLPIRIGTVEATAISMGIDPQEGGRPMTHDLLLSAINNLGGTVRDVCINDVSGTTFFAVVEIDRAAGEMVSVDARPSDAIALAVRTDVPIYAEGDVIETAGLPDFGAIEENEREHEIADFHDFVQSLSPDDFNATL